MKLKLNIVCHWFVWQSFLQTFLFSNSLLACYIIYGHISKHICEYVMAAAQSLPSPGHTERPGNTKDRKREYTIIIVRGWKINQTIANLSLSLSLSLTHIQCLSSLCPHQSGVSLGLSLLWRQEVHLGLVTLQKLPADVTAATRATQTWSNIHTTWTVFRFSSSIRTWVLCVAPGRPCPPHPAAWTRWLLPLCWETGASWEIYLLPRL